MSGIRQVSRVIAALIAFVTILGAASNALIMISAVAATIFSTYLVIYFIMKGRVILATHFLCLVCVLAIGPYLYLHSLNTGLRFSGMLRPEAFYDENIFSAIAICTLSTLAFGQAAIEFVGGDCYRWPEPSPAEMKSAKWVSSAFLGVGMVVTALTTGGDSVFSRSYQGDLDAVAMVDSGGLAFLGLVLLSIGMSTSFRAYPKGELQGSLLRLAGLAVIVVLKFSRGDRGGTLTILLSVSAAWFLANVESDRLNLGIRRFMLGVCLVVIMQLMGEFRAVAVEAGFEQGILLSISRLFDSENTESFDPLSIQLIPAGFWHVMNTAELRRNNDGPGFLGFANLLLQVPPEFVANYFGTERPLNGPWLYASYRVNSGGLMFAAETFWYGGWVGLIASSIGLSWVICRIERGIARSSPLLAAPYLALCGSSLFAMYYGLQPLMKAFLIAALLSAILRRLVRSRMAVASSGVPISELMFRIQKQERVSSGVLRGGPVGG